MILRKQKQFSAWKLESVPLAFLRILCTLPKGNWFLVKESDCFDEETGPGICTELVALTGDEALTWLTKQQAVDAIQTHFPDQLEEA